MPVELKMPALSPTMEKGSIARWLVHVGDAIRPGDLIAEVETDKATMEVEAVDEGFLVDILVPDGSVDVPVGTPIAIIGEVAVAAERSVSPAMLPSSIAALPALRQDGHIKATPIARRIAAVQGIDLATITGSGPAGRIVKADLGIPPLTVGGPLASASLPADTRFVGQQDIPHEEVRLSSMRKTIARRLTESKQQAPHIYLTLDVRLDELLALRVKINDALEPEGIRVSVNDMLIKALALSLMKVPACNVSFVGDSLLRFARADISVAVSIPDGLITPVIRGAETKSLSAIAIEMKDLAALAREGRLKPQDYQGGTASLSNLGMFGIRQFDAVINPPQAMILAVGAGEKRPFVVDGQLAVATAMSVTGSFDHRAIDGADAALLMQAFRAVVEEPVRLLA